MEIASICRNYFNGFSEVQKWNTLTTREKVSSFIKIASYFTLIIPLIFGVAYSLSSLVGRVTKKDGPSTKDIRTGDVAKKALKKEAEPLDEKKQEDTLYSYQLELQFTQSLMKNCFSPSLLRDFLSRAVCIVVEHHEKKIGKIEDLLLRQEKLSLFHAEIVELWGTFKPAKGDKEVFCGSDFFVPHDSIHWGFYKDIRIPFNCTTTWKDLHSQFFVRTGSIGMFKIQGSKVNPNEFVNVETFSVTKVPKWQYEMTEIEKETPNLDKISNKEVLEAFSEYVGDYKLEIPNHPTIDNAYLTMLLKKQLPTVMDHYKKIAAVQDMKIREKCLRLFLREVKIMLTHYKEAPEDNLFNSMYCSGDLRFYSIRYDSKSTYAYLHAQIFVESGNTYKLMGLYSQPNSYQQHRRELSFSDRYCLETNKIKSVELEPTQWDYEKELEKSQTG